MKKQLFIVVHTLLLIILPLQLFAQKEDKVMQHLSFYTYKNKITKEDNYFKTVTYQTEYSCNKESYKPQIFISKKHLLYLDSLQNNGSFSKNDLKIFYENGTLEWTLVLKLNNKPASDSSHCFITFKGKKQQSSTNTDKLFECLLKDLNGRNQITEKLLQDILLQETFILWEKTLN